MNSRFGSALLVALFASQGAAQATTRADSAIVAKALDAVRTFQKAWEREWMTGQRAQFARMNQLEPGVKIVGDPTINVDPFGTTAFGLDPRGQDANCYFGMDEKQTFLSDHAWGVPVKQRAIASAANKKHWVCPNWLPPENFYVSGAGLPDEGASIDNALEPAARTRIAGLRSTLIRQLATAVNRAPSDSALIGQYVRMLVDAGDAAAAQVVTDNCRAHASWCLALRGFVNAKLNQMFDAEDAYLTSLDSMTVAEQCSYAGIGALLDEYARKAYTLTTCSQKDSVNRTTWWLADPLWSVPGNDRLVEHFSRKVTIALHSALGRDERYSWLTDCGGDALSEMVERYGWMSYTYGRRPLRCPNPYSGWRTTYEYSLGRVHVIPPMSMVNDPFSITNADWSMNAPGGEWDYTLSWWPDEHYAPLHPLTKLVDQQTALLRRQDSILIAFATPLSKTDLGRKLGDSVDAVILASPRPGAIRRVANKKAGAQSRLTFLSSIPSAPTLISVEIPWTAKGQRAARSRFGVKPPPPLSAMKAEEHAISEPIILAVPMGAESIPSSADSAVGLMLGSTTLAAGTSSIGVYWETYGIAPQDSVQITVTIQRRGGGSPVATTWTEPQPGHAIRNVPGVVPIQMRSLVLDISALAIDSYVLEISVTKRGSPALRSSREFTIR